jgi:regulator of protease activity HflC (stomatin/prohibitin superfamily)
MKKFVLLFLCLILLLITAGCWVDVGPGQAAIRVNKFGNKRGVEDKPLMTGRVNYGYGQQVIIYPITEQTWAYSAKSGDGSDDDQSFTANSVDSSSVSFDVQISFSVDPNKLPKFYSTYACDLPTFINSYLRNAVRDAFVSEVSQMPVETIMGSGIPKIGLGVKNTLNEKFKDLGVIFSSVGIVNSPRPQSQDVINAMNAKIAATQKAIEVENQIRSAKAEAEKQIASAKGDAESTLIKARAEAEANRLLSQSLNALLVEKMRIEKLNPNVQVIYLPSNSNLWTGLPKQ